MRKLVLFTTCMATLCIHGATLEEARQLVREYVELYVKLPPGYNEKTSQMYPAIQALDRDIRLSLYCEVMAERFDDPNPQYVNFIVRRFFAEDTWDGSPVNEEAVSWARRVWLEKRFKRGYDLRTAEWYMSFKGDAGDLDDMMMIENQERLAARVAGTNIISHSLEGSCSNGIPSVTNTGLQALCVDAMPELDVQDRPEPKLNVATASLPSEDETQRLEAVATMDDTPPNRPWLYAVILSALCAGTVLWFTRKRK